MTLKVGELAKIGKVTVRTLRHYDRIGLLVAKKNPFNGYREYEDSAVDRLQEILLLRELGFGLPEIAEILGSADYERLAALKKHRSLTLRRIEELKLLYRSIDASVKEMEEGIKMDQKKKFEGRDFRHNPYEAEAREKWGSQVDESNARLEKRSAQELGALAERMNAVFLGFSELRGEDPRSEAAVALSRQFHELLNAEVGSFYTKEVFAGLALMYVEDERFTQNLDKWGEGCARFMSEAMTWYAQEYL